MRRHRSRFAGRIPGFGAAPLCLLLAGAVLACSGKHDPEAARLRAVEPPPDLARLDRSVRDQFSDLAAQLEAAGRERPAAAAAWGDLGRWYEVYGYEGSAGLCYANAELLQPDEARWPYYRGRLAETGGRLEEATELYRRASDLAPDAAAPRVRLGDVAMRRNDVERAAELYRQVLAEDPDQPGALLGSAQASLVHDDPRAAVESLERLARAQPEAAQVHYSLALAWRRLGDDARADGHLARVPAENLDQIGLDFDFPWDAEVARVDVGSRMLTRRGLRAFRRGEHEKAAVLLGRAVAADPEGPEKRLNYALALRKVGRAAAADDELRTALELAEEGSELAAKAHVELGRAMVESGRLEAGAAHLATALSIDPGSIPAHAVLGRLRHRQGRIEEALAHYAALRGSPREVRDADFWHAALLLALDRREAAKQALREDLDRDPGSRGARILLARALATEDTPSPAEIEQARRLLVASGPADVLFAETAAMVAAASSRFAEAAAWQRAALATLETVRAPASLHAARRRLVLYDEGTRCRTPWERQERHVTLAVEPPRASPLRPSLPSSGEPR